MSDHETIQPDGWPRPSGYANGVSARGRIIAIAGQVGWHPVTMKFASIEMVDQVRVALENIVAVLKSAGAEPKHVIRMTWFVTDGDEYTENTKRIGEVYREVFGRNFPAMSVVVVAALIEPGAMVEIEATAVVPEETNNSNI